MITDVRYPNELEWISSFNRSTNVYVERIGFLPANKEEAKNCPILKRNSDYLISWPTFGKDNTEDGLPLVKSFINERLKTRQPTS